MAADEPLSPSSRSASASISSRLVEPTSVTTALLAGRVERRGGERGQGRDRRGAEDQLGGGDRVATIEPAASSSAPSSSARSRLSGSGSKPATSALEPPLRGEPDRAADQADAEDRDLHGVALAPRDARRPRACPRPRRPACTCSAYSAKPAVGSACGPSQIACSGSLWTSTMIPSAPAAAAASDIDATQSRRPGRVARVDDDRQVGELAQRRDRQQVEGEPVGGLERADPALAEDHVRVALLEHVLRRHQQVVEGRRQPALEQHRLAAAPDLGQQLVVLHVAGADLDHVGDLDHVLDVADVHQLGDDRQPGLLLGLLEQPQALDARGPGSCTARCAACRRRRGASSPRRRRRRGRPRASARGSRPCTGRRSARSGRRRSCGRRRRPRCARPC